MHVIYSTASSLDGYLADPDQSLAWLFVQDHGENGAPTAPDLRTDVLIDRAQAVLMGSTTYQWVRGELGEQEWPYTQPTWVLSHRDPADIGRVDGADLRFSSGDVGEVMDEIRASVQDPDGVLWIVGGGDLAGQFADAGLLDEVVVTYAPVTLGAGAPLLPLRLQLNLQTTEVFGQFLCARFLVEGIRPEQDWT